MSPLSRKPLGGRLIVGLLLALATATSAAAAEQTAAAAPFGHNAVVVSLHNGTDLAAPAPLRHASANGALAAVAVGHAGAVGGPHLSTWHLPSRARSRPTTAAQPRAPPHSLRDL